MQSVILCVFEGEKREHQYFNNLQKHFLDGSNIVKCSFGNDIYELYKALAKEEYAVDTLEVIKESKDVPKNKELLAGYEVDDINQIYLFFDMDCHDGQYSEQKLTDMVDYFSDETDMGKLFISYPMIEAIRDLESIDEFMDKVVTLQECANYKQLSARGVKELSDPRKVSKSMWFTLVELNVKKACRVVSDLLENDLEQLALPEQLDIAVSQCQALEQRNIVFVLSAFPIFLFHQYGQDFIPGN
ncbi:hypothetical protein [Pseudoalteromonas luteoviolacea]|uniref:Uncharacterized protein n=2 Tax=Pseudoalteromonas luteoviolacea TaxID=43657 RepID=A0A166UE58_9GAMM|nr:hypothetical protein [Pseudoalteromonas luteoviolacea]KZN29863.1 hypothetical protein N475_25140 [Pseudoalteromonas luteoviolacea DSM 6061]